VLQGSSLDPAGQTGYVATGSYGLAIVNASSFQKPVVLGQIQLGGNSTDVAVDTKLQIAAVATGTALQLVDVSDPMTPKLSKSVAVGATRVVGANGIAYAAYASSVESFDLLTGDNLQILTLSAATITGMAREGTMLYTMDSNNTLRAIDISQFQMVPRGSLTLTDGGGRLFVGNGIAYIPAASRSNGGFATVNVSNPASPVLISGPQQPPQIGYPKTAIAANGSGIGLLVGNVAGSDSIDVMNTSDITNTNNFLTQFNLPATPQGVAIASGIAYVADGSGGLEVVNYLPFDTKGVPPTVAISVPGVTVNQVVEGSTIVVRADARDDVQVRNVELLVNGQVVLNDVSFPFNLSAIAPKITLQSSAMTLQVRATDTGGNISLSNLITLNIVPDTTAPQILSIDPADGTSRGTGLQTVRIRFSKPIATATVTADNFNLLDGSGQRVRLANLQLQSDDRLVQLTFAPLPSGSYQLVINSPGVTDRVGHQLGTGTIVSYFQIARSLYSAVWINPAGGFWDDPQNWDRAIVPGPADDVLIDVPGNVTITHRQGTSLIHSLLSRNAFTLSGGTLDARSTVEVDNVFMLNGGATLAHATVLRGSGGQGIIPRGVFLDGVTVNADMDLTNPSGNQGVLNGLTLNGTARLGPYSGFYFYGGGTLAGTGTVICMGTSFAPSYGIFATADLTIGPGITVQGHDGQIGGYGNTINQGMIIADSASGPLEFIGGFLDNRGTLEAQNGGRLLGLIRSNAGIVTVGAGSTISSSVSFSNAGTVSVGAGSTFTAGPPTVNGNYTQTAGTTMLQGGVLTSVLVDIRGGMLSGSGTVNVTVGTVAGNLRNAGQMNPGGSGVAGTLTITGNYTQFAAGSLNIAIGGLTAGSQYDQLAITGAAALDGTLNLSQINNFVPSAGNTFQVIATGSLSGTFATINGTTISSGLVYHPTYSNTGLTLTVGQPQFFAGTSKPPAADTPALTQDQLLPAVTQAIADLAAAGFNVTGLDQVDSRLDNLPGSLLGLTSQNTIWIDQNAAGYGWYIDVSPGSDVAFTQPTGANEVQAAPGSPAYGHVDLLTVVTHELGHLLGFASIGPGLLSHDWTTATLGTGVRRYPDAANGSTSGPYQSPAGGTTSVAGTSAGNSPQVLPVSSGQEQASLRVVSVLDSKGKEGSVGADMPLIVLAGHRSSTSFAPNPPSGGQQDKPALNPNSQPVPLLARENLEEALLLLQAETVRKKALDSVFADSDNTMFSNEFWHNLIGEQQTNR
jgi:hypothetical protein